MCKTCAFRANKIIKNCGIDGWFLGGVLSITTNFVENAIKSTKQSPLNPQVILANYNLLIPEFSPLYTRPFTTIKLKKGIL